jgi:hypothetical protein
MRGDVDDVRSYRYKITTGSGDVLCFAWERTYHYLTAAFMALDGQYEAQAKESAIGLMRRTVETGVPAEFRDGSYCVIPNWTLEREGEADCGHREPTEACVLSPHSGTMRGVRRYRAPTGAGGKMSEHSKVVNYGIPCGTCGGTEYVCAEATPPASDERREALDLIEDLDSWLRGVSRLYIGSQYEKRVAAILAAKEEK